MCAWGLRALTGTASVLKRPMRAVIVGGGYIGMEMSESLIKRGLDVMVIEKMDRILGNMDTSITAIVEEKIMSEGVKLSKGVSVKGFEGDNGALARVITDEDTHEVDLALLVIGAKPNTKLAQETGIELGANGAIKIDEHLRTNVADIFAAGDCAEATQLVTGRRSIFLSAQQPINRAELPVKTLPG